MIKIKIKKGDNVKIIAGDDKGKSGEVIKILPTKNKAIIKGCNIVKKTIKPDKDKNPDGGFIDKEMPINISNIKKDEAK
jgi:large subunit ribosomal protein L24